MVIAFQHAPHVVRKVQMDVVVQDIEGVAAGDGLIDLRAVPVAMMGPGAWWK